LAQLKCPSCGYRSDDADFSISGGAAGTSDGKSAALQTPQPGVNGSKTGFQPQQTSVRGMANGDGQAVELARRAPVRTGGDIVHSRTPGGPAVIRHRQGGTQIAEIRHLDDGTWQSVVDGKALAPHSHQRAALMEAIGVYNSGSALPARELMPLQRPAVQTQAMAAMGLENIRAFASDPDDDGDDDSTVSGDTDKDGPGGLNPKGQAIYKKLTAKGMAPKVAMAMAKRAQDAKPGAFGKAG
jgi:hypothetical protein